ncbi:MAG: hypothetical protein AB2L14_36985 [Candidatus Xenobiia bacterium LiM19]
MRDTQACVPVAWCTGGNGSMKSSMYGMKPLPMKHGKALTSSRINSFRTRRTYSDCNGSS